LNNSNRMISVPCDLLEQALDAASVGMQDVADELDRILTPQTCSACDDQGAPAPKTIPATLMQAMENLAVKALAANHPPFFPPGGACQAPLVMLDGVCLRVTYSGLKWYHDQLIDDRWEPLSVDEFEALLTTALHGCTEEGNR